MKRLTLNLTRYVPYHLKTYNIYELKSYKISNNIYQISNYLIISVIIFNVLYQEKFGELTPQKIAIILFIIVLLSSTGKSLTQLFNYRKNI